jgi:hypothetical protein
MPHMQVLRLEVRLEEEQRAKQDLGRQVQQLGNQLEAARAELAKRPVSGGLARMSAGSSAHSPARSERHHALPGEAGGCPSRSCLAASDSC